MKAKGYWGMGNRKKHKAHFFLNGHSLCNHNVPEGNVAWRCEFDEFDPVANKDIVCSDCVTRFELLKRGMRKVEPVEEVSP